MGKMGNSHGKNWNMERKLKNLENRHTYCRTWNMVRNSKNMKNKKYTL